jgi:radical SAM superfamily enzyme YgiQ (UPF0313 family)
MNIVLAYKCHDLGRMEFYSRFTPLGLGYINALLRREGHDARIVNMSAWTWRRVARFLQDERPALLGVSTFTFNRHASMRVAALARAARPDTLIVAGGPHATHLAHHLLQAYPAVDLVVRGEGEETMVEIARCEERGTLERDLPSIRGLTYRVDANGIPVLGRGAMHRGLACLDTPDRPVIADLDRLPHPAADPATVGVDPVSQFEFVITSRGCPAACTFCSSPDFWGRALRFRSAQNMLDEIRLLRERHGVVYVSIRDDTFTVNKRRVIDFCRALIAAKIDLLWDCQSRVNAVDEERLSWMRRAGCTHIQYGVESGSPRMLRRLNKGINLDEVRAAAATTRRVGLGLSIYLITGIESETDEDLASTLNLIEEILPHDGLVSPLTVYPGTAQYEQAKRTFGLSERFWVEDRGEAFFVRNDPWTRRSLRTIQRALRRTARRAAYGPADFAAQRAIVGDCHALRLSIGDYLEGRRRLGPAGEEYRALLRDEPHSLWARMRLGGLAARAGRYAEASDHYAMATHLVPAFHLAHSLLGAAQLQLRNRQAAAASFHRAAALCPHDATLQRQARRLRPAALPPDW